MLLKWSSNSFRKMVKIPCNLGLLEILHVDLFKRISLILFDAQFLLGQFLNGTYRDQFPLDHDSDPFADPLDLIEQVGGEKDGDPPFPAEIMNEIEHPVRSVRVEPDRGLIEKDELGILDQNLGNPQALPHPFRIEARLSSWPRPGGRPARGSHRSGS